MQTDIKTSEMVKEEEKEEEYVRNVSIKKEKGQMKYERLKFNERSKRRGKKKKERKKERKKNYKKRKKQR